MRNGDGLVSRQKLSLLFSKREPAREWQQKSLIVRYDVFWYMKWFILKFIFPDVSQLFIKTQNNFQFLNIQKYTLFTCLFPQNSQQIQTILYSILLMSSYAQSVPFFGLQIKFLSQKLFEHIYNSQFNHSQHNILSSLCSIIFNHMEINDRSQQQSGCRKFCAQMFSIENWYLFPHDFTPINGQGIYCMNPQFYTAFRIFILTLSIMNLTYVSTFFHSTDLLYFTTWGLLLNVLAFSILAIENIINYFLKTQTNLKYWKVTHFLFTIVLFFQVFINAIYWLGLFPFAVVNLWGELGLVDILNPILLHAVPLLFLVLDFQINPYVIWNYGFIPYYYGLLILYLIVNSIYTVNVNAIYAMMTFDNWITAGFILACVVVVPICHLILRVFCKYYKQKLVLRMLLMSTPNESQVQLKQVNLNSNIQEQLHNIEAHKAIN